jgi:hypothetical protein
MSINLIQIPTMLNLPNITIKFRTVAILINFSIYKIRFRWNIWERVGSTYVQDLISSSPYFVIKPKGAYKKLYFIFPMRFY